MERRLAVPARPAVIASLLVASLATAAPRRPAAKAAFERGVAAYKKADYGAASQALARSFALEADADTLYAWAQTERKQNHCAKAIELYQQLLGMALPAANRAAVRTQIDECTAILAAQEPAEPSPAEPPSVEPPVAPPRAAPAPSAPSQLGEAGLEPSRAPDAPPLPRGRTPSRWTNPLGLGLVSLGAIGLGAGAVFLVQARGADADKDAATTYGDWARFADRARSRGRIGAITAASGAGLVIAGIVYIVTRKPAEEQPIAVLAGPAGASVVATAHW